MLGKKVNTVRRLLREEGLPAVAELWMAKVESAAEQRATRPFKIRAQRD